MIKNSLKNSMNTLLFDKDKFSGQFYVSNIRDELEDNIDYYDIWFFAGNLTKNQYSTLL